MTIAPFPSSFKGDIVTPSSPDYEQAIVRWAKNAQKNAKVVAFVKDEDDIVLAIKYAKENNLPMAVHGGGHSPAGASSIEGGLVIDLARHMSYCRVDEEKKLAYVGGGTVWNLVDKTTIEYGLATVAGTVSHTGVGGLSLGGGFGWLTGEHGLTIDNIEGHRIVTPSGEILNANSKENSDLYWGLRGGGGNFGVVTEFIFKLHPQRKTVYFGKLVYTPDKLEKIMEILGEWWNTGIKEKEAAQIALTIGPNGKPAIIFIPFYNGTEEEGRANFKKFHDVGPVVDDTREMPYNKINSFQDEIFDYGRCVYLGGTAHGSPNHTTAKKAFDRVVAASEEFDVFPAVLLDYSSLKKMLSVPRDATPFRRDDKGYAAYVFMYKENTEENREKVKKAVNELKVILKEGQPNLTDSQNLGYSNLDFEYTTKDKAPLVFGANYPRLQQLKKKYDPEERFSKWFPITPAA